MCGFVPGMCGFIPETYGEFAVDALDVRVPTVQVDWQVSVNSISKVDGENRGEGFYGVLSSARWC